MATLTTRRDEASSVLDTVPAVLAGAAAALLGPLTAAAPRGLPVWAILVTLIGGAALLRRGGAGALRPSGPACWLALAFLALVFAGVGWSPSGRALPTALEIAYIAAGALLTGRAIGGLDGAAAARLARLFIAGLVVGIAAFAAEDALNYPVHRWINHVPADVMLEDGNVPKRTAVVFALLAWPAALALHRLARPRLALALPLLYGVSTLAQSSRSAMAGIAVGLAAFALARRFPVGMRRVLAALLVVAFAGAVPIGLTLDRGLGLADASWLFQSARHRVELWSLAAGRTERTPLLGHGIDASRALKTEGEFRRFPPDNDSLLPLHPHNAYLQIWLETGAAGAALVLAMALLLLAATRRLPPAEQAFALALFATGLAEVSSAYGIWQAWWMAGLLASALALRLAARVRAA